MDAPILAYLVTGLLYAGLSVHLWRTRWLTPAQAAADAARSRSWERAAVAGALAAHTWLLYATVLAGAGMRLGVGNAISIILWLTVLIYSAGSLLTRLDGLQALVMPVAAIGCLLPLVLPPARLLPNSELIAFKVHLLISLLAYGFFTIASLHVLLMALQERHLHGGNLPALLAGLPPLLTMEKLLFQLIGGGFGLLTLTLVSGIFFSEELFGRPISFNHKTIFGILSWCIFGALLAGRHFYGWRGRVATRWTLAGFLMLVLAYLGSRFVLDVILLRGG